MSEEFGTVNLKRDQSRELEMVRRHYRTHRDTLTRLIGDAPSEHLAAEYQRLVGEIDMAVRKLDELEGKAVAPPSPSDTNPAMKSGPGNRPLVRPPDGSQPAPAIIGRYPVRPRSGSRSRVALIVIAGIVVLAIIGWLIWRGTSERKQPAPITEGPAATTNAAPTPAITPAPAVAKPTLTITPAVRQYGTIRRGARAVRQFEITNSGDNAVDIEIARSACHCLYYSDTGKVPARGKETITVTIDGARAKLGNLEEQIEVHAKNDPAVSATFSVQATIR